MFFLSLCWLAPGNVACGINVDVSLHSLRARWVMRNSLTVKRHANRFYQTWFTTPQFFFLAPSSLPTFFSILPPHLLVTFILSPPFLLPSKQIKEQMRREEWYGWWGMPKCQQMTSSADGGREGEEKKEKERERMWWKEKSIPWKLRLEKKWLMRPDVRLLLAWIIAFPMTKQKLPPISPNIDAAGKLLPRL